MVVASSLLGILAGWLLVLTLAMCIGYGLVVAWQRWGGRVRLPPEMMRVATRLLGPPQERPVGGSPAGQGGAPLPGGGKSEDEPGDAAADERSGGDGDVDDEDGDGDGSDGPDTLAADHSGPDAAPEPGRDEAGPHDEEGEDDKHDGATKEPVMDAATARADALEEIAVLFDSPYEAVDALFKTGLRGMDNHDEWARAMRGRAPPPGVPPETYHRVVNADPSGYRQRLEEIRAKRDAMKRLLSLWGVGPEQAEVLYQAGFRDLETIRTSSTEKLAKVPGITQALAFQIRAAAHGLAPTP